jgi:hypothetical protein
MQPTGERRAPKPQHYFVNTEPLTPEPDPARTDYYFIIMTAASIPVLLLLLSSPMLSGAVNQSCAARSGDASYVHVHGRLGVYNGGYPNLRLWHIGTHHLFGIYSGPADLQCQRGGTCNGDDDTNLPSNLDALMALPNPLFEFEVYGDFEIRLLEPFRPGHMQAACIVDAHKLVRRRSE